MGSVQVGRGVGRWMGYGGECSVNGGNGERLLSKLSINRFLKILTEGAVTTEGGSLFQYFTALTENADPLRWCPLRPRRAGGRKNKFGRTSWTWRVCERIFHLLKSSSISVNHVEWLRGEKTITYVQKTFVFPRDDDDCLFFSKLAISEEPPCFW